MDPCGHHRQACTCRLRGHANSGAVLPITTRDQQATCRGGGEDSYGEDDAGPQTTADGRQPGERWVGRGGTANNNSYLVIYSDTDLIHPEVIEVTCQWISEGGIWKLVSGMLYISYPTEWIVTCKTSQFWNDCLYLHSISCWVKIWYRASTVMISTIYILTHCGLVMLYGDMDLGQHWLR